METGVQAGQPNPYDSGTDSINMSILAAFVFELATVNADYFIPARVLVGLGAICFTLFLSSASSKAVLPERVKKHSFYWF